MKRRIYIYQENMNEELVDLFNTLGDNIIVEEHNNDIITILDMDFYNPEPIDFVTFQELIQDDFNSDLIMFIEPYQEDGFSLGVKIKEFLKNMKSGVYFFEDIIPYVVLQQNEALKNDIRDYIHSKVNSDVVHTVREFISNNMNSSSSAKKLFMHRNTLNYRVDNFIETTHINVKTFKGANAVYMLFKY